MKSEQMFVGTVEHKLSHRSLTVHVYMSTRLSSQVGRHPSGVAMSVLDQKIIEIVRKSGHEQTSFGKKDDMTHR